MEISTLATVQTHKIDNANAIIARRTILLGNLFLYVYVLSKMLNIPKNTNVGIEYK
jgi:hypothetical protein